MKRILSFVSIFIFTCLSTAQNSLGLDPSYGNAGRVITSVNSGEDVARGGVLQSDGKLVVAGYTFDNVFGYDFICLRYNLDGSLDTNFGTNGVAQFDLQVGSDDRALSIDLQLDGKIILAGFSDDGTDRDGAVVRLNTDGTIDSTFGNAGVSLTDFGESDQFNTVKVHLVTGNIVAAGTSYRTTTRSNGVFARYLPNGVLDTNFNTDGKLENLPSPVSGTLRELSIEDLAIKANGRITAVGWLEYTGQTGSAASHYECRLNVNGSFDTTFSNNGYDFDLMTTAYDYTYAMVANPNDSFEFAGYTRYTTFAATTDRRGYIHGSNSTGGTTFSPTVVQFSESIDEYIFGMARDNNGNLIVGGTINDTSSSPSFEFFVAKLDNTGDAFDTNFGNGGLIRTSFSTDAVARDLKVQSDNKILLIGYVGNDIAISRYTEQTLGISSNEQQIKISFYPNPVRDFLTVSLNNNNDNDLSHAIEVYDISGRIVSKTMPIGDNTSINVSGLKSGMYIVHFNDQSAKFQKL